MCGSSLEQVVKKGPFEKETFVQASGNLRVDLSRQRKQGQPDSEAWPWLLGQ